MDGLVKVLDEGVDGHCREEGLYVVIWWVVFVARITVDCT